MATAAVEDIVGALAASGAEVLSDPASLEFYAHDIYARGADLAAVVRPADKHQLAAAVAAAAEHGLAVIPRGGGMSYTGGYTADEPGAVLLDLGRMNRVLDINRQDMTVTLEAGCTWAQRHEALRRPHSCASFLARRPRRVTPARMVRRHDPTFRRPGGVDHGRVVGHRRGARGGVRR